MKAKLQRKNYLTMDLAFAHTTYLHKQECIIGLDFLMWNLLNVTFISVVAYAYKFVVLINQILDWT